MVADDGSSAQVTIPVEADFLYVYSSADGRCFCHKSIENIVSKYMIAGGE